MAAPVSTLTSPYQARRALPAIALLLLASTSTTVGAASQEDLALGKQLYRTGLLPNGQAVKAHTGDGVPLNGSQLSCAGCHRRSGFGSSEGEVLVPPVAGDILFKDNARHDRELGGTGRRAAGSRPAYTESSLKRAIREGVDVEGRPLNTNMPRFAIGDEDLDRLIAYLKTLNNTAAPGITPEQIHLATVITPGVDAGQRSAMLDTLQRYFSDLSANTRREVKRAQHSPWHKTWHYGAYRQYSLHTWELQGAPETWRRQLEQYYRQQPVFALVGGIGSGSWAPIHRFCEEQTLPCLFPTTDQPTIADGDFYSLYFSKGLVHDAQSLAKHLLQSQGEDKPLRILQLYRAGGSGELAAASLRRQLNAAGGIGLEEFALDAEQPLSAAYGALREQPAPGLRIIAWLGPEDLDALGALAERLNAEQARFYLSARLLRNNLTAIPHTLAAKSYLISPFNPDSMQANGPPRLQFWAKARGLEVTHPQVMGNAYFAAMIAGNAIKRLRANLNRDYFIELIEHMVDKAVFASVYPHLSLAPGQRFALKGSYIIGPLDQHGSKHSRLARQWVVPD